MSVQPAPVLTANTFTKRTRSPTTPLATVSRGMIAFSGISTLFMAGPGATVMPAVPADRTAGTSVRSSQLRRATGRAPLHIGGVLLEFDCGSADVKRQDHMS